MLSFTKENKISSFPIISPVENCFFMQPTYSVSEIKLLIKSLDLSSINILRELVEEEKKDFAGYELKAIFKFIQLRNKELVGNEVKTEFLLSFN